MARTMRESSTSRTRGRGSGVSATEGINSAMDVHHNAANDAGLEEIVEDRRLLGERYLPRQGETADDLAFCRSMRYALNAIGGPQYTRLAKIIRCGRLLTEPSPGFTPEAEAAIVRPHVGPPPPERDPFRLRGHGPCRLCPGR